MVVALTGFVVEKKSISLPIVKGTLIDTVEDTSNRPMAIVNGFHSGLASDIILANEEVLFGSFGANDEGIKRERSDRFAAGLEIGEAEGGGDGGGADCVELNLRADHLTSVEELRPLHW